MIEVAIAAVEAVFDWKKFENEQFGTNYELDANDETQTDACGVNS